MKKQNKITQEKAVFYILWKAFKENPQQFIPAWRFVGELHIKELNTWFFMSYKCPTNGLEIYNKNPQLIERRKTTGKTGARYYEYRIAPNPSSSRILDADLLAFYKKLKATQGVPVRSNSTEGKVYTVQARPDGTYECTCDGFHFRKECSHIEEWKSTNAQNEKQ